MGTLVCSGLIAQARATLKDSVAAYQWSDADLLLFLDAGQRAAVLLRPDCGVRKSALQLTANSARQALPSSVWKLFDIPRNLGADGVTPGRAITRASLLDLHQVNPAWVTDANSYGAIHHFCYDEANPRVFWVWPKAPATAWYVELDGVTIPAMPTLGGAIDLDDIYGNALIEYMVVRALADDIEVPANELRANAAYARFLSLLGVANNVGEAG